MDLEGLELEIFNQIKSTFTADDEISISIIQRRFMLGYNAAGRIMDALVSDRQLSSCPKCHDRGWLYDDLGNRAGNCPCHY